MNDLAAAICKSSSKVHEDFRYSHVGVLFIHWEKDELSVLPRWYELEKILKRRYGFHTAQFAIPIDARSTDVLAKAMAKFRGKFGSTHCVRCLTIFIYSGYSSPEGTNCWIWGKQDKTGSITSSRLNWPEQRVVNRISPSPVMYIMDCAYATGINMMPMCETLATASWSDSGVPTCQWLSMIPALTEFLKRMDGVPVTVAEIHAMLVAKWNRQRNQPIPIHQVYQRCKSLFIAPVMNHKQRARTELMDSPIMDGFDIRVLLKISCSSKPDCRLKKYTEVYIWNMAFNRPSRSIEIHSVLEGGRTTHIYITLPIRIWDFLRDDTAYIFVDFVRSRDIFNGLSASEVADRMLQIQRAPPLAIFYS
ncbi:hypothetical protein M501DRAFT_1030226 [Patellaria atrata CBS 101060]|uniref:Uncharacterized protein n=1 Tax=Patellaria atrata CBS 101060 TaxID=1346257 RepID=A0A9P4SE76_9PEZI|nr:hypothetical protein M501DRAFT_1030226 [Patellaria atrata CBS 101060]